MLSLQSSIPLKVRNDGVRATMKFYAVFTVQARDAGGEISTVRDAAHLSDPAAWERETATGR